MKLTPGIVSKPWGHELVWAWTPKYAGKVLHISAGHKLSLQHHNKKEETIHLFSGRMQFFIDEGDGLKVHELSSGDCFHIPSGAIHRMEALEDCVVFEVSTPELDDVVRHQDDYGRA